LSFVPREDIQALHSFVFSHWLFDFVPGPLRRLKEPNAVGFPE
jgi:hypothetical protein